VDLDDGAPECGADPVVSTRAPSMPRSSLFTSPERVSDVEGAERCFEGRRVGVGGSASFGLVGKRGRLPGLKFAPLAPASRVEGSSGGDDRGWGTRGVNLGWPAPPPCEGGVLAADVGDPGGTLVWGRSTVGWPLVGGEASPKVSPKSEAETGPPVGGGSSTGATGGCSGDGVLARSGTTGGGSGLAASGLGGEIDDMSGTSVRKCGG
jgi:hypothetical protein